MNYLRKLRKGISLALSVSMLIPIIGISGCGKSEKKDAVIAAEEPWFDDVITPVSSSFDNDSSVGYKDISVLAKCEEGFITFVDGSYEYPDDFDYSNDSTMDYTIASFELIAEDGSIIRSQSAIDLIRERIADNSSVSFHSIEYLNGLVCFTVNTFFEEDGEYKDISYRGSYDIGSSSLVSFDEVEDNNSIENSSNEGTVHLDNGYSITKLYLWGDSGKSSYILTVTDPDNEKHDIDLRTAFPDEEIYNIDALLSLDETRVLVIPSCAGDQQFYIINLNDMSIEIYAEDISWMETDSFYGIRSINGLGIIRADENGVVRYDFENKQEETILSFDDTYVSKAMMRYMTLISCSEDSFIFAGSYNSSQTGYQYTEQPVIISLTRAQTNPNAGRKVITAASLGYLNNGISQAISDFNRNDSEYFIRTTDEYSIDSYFDYSDSNQDKDWSLETLRARSEMSNKLAIDLMSGDGPDIILNGLGYSMLNNENYLLDLSDRVSTEGCFPNAVASAYTGDKLFQIPLAFGIKGIITDSQYVDEGQIGFTFDRYTEFVSGPCNGRNPIFERKLDAFDTIVSSMGSDFITEDGGFNYDNEAFRVIAEYVDQNFRDELDFEGEDYDYYDESNEAAFSTIIWGMGGMLSNYGSNASNKAILGLPSTDGRGTTLVSDYSVGVSAQTQYADGCIAFVETLLSSDIQEYFFSEGIPMSIAAFDSLAAQTVQEFNDTVHEYRSLMSESELRACGYCDIESSFIDSCKEIIGNASGYSNSTDAAVQIILREEIQAYFAGQKTIDQVIEIMQDKVDTYVSERG